MQTHTLKSEVLQSQQFLHSLSPDTLLPLDLAAPLIGKTALTLRQDVLRRPANTLPILTRIGRRIFMRKSDIDEFLNKSRVLPVPEKKIGRPTKREQLARQTAATHAE